GYDLLSLARGIKLLGKLDWLKLMLDVGQAVQSVKPAGRVATVGYCFGGAVGWTASARLRGLACAVSYYPSKLVSLVNEVPRIPVLLHVGQRDVHLPVERVRELCARYPSVTLHEYDAGHGFNCDHRPDYEPIAAALAFDRTLAFLRTHVG